MYATGKPARSTSLADTPSYAPGTMRPCFRLTSWRSRWRRFMVTRQGITLRGSTSWSMESPGELLRDVTAIRTPVWPAKQIPGGGAVDAPALERGLWGGTPVLESWGEGAGWGV